MTGPNETLPDPVGGPLAVVTDGETGDLVARATLVVVSGKLTGRVFPLIRAETHVGRTGAAHIRIEERAISNRHATIVLGPEGHSVIDHGSTNGTFLNGRRVQPNQLFELNPGDSLQFAETVLTYLPANADGSQEQTHYLSKLIPQVAASSALQLPASGMPDAQLLVQLLKATQPPEEPPGLTLDQRLEQLRQLFEIARRHWIILFACTTMFALAAVIVVFMNPPPSVAKCTLRITPPTTAQPQPFDREGDSYVTRLDQHFRGPKLIESTLKSMGNPTPARHHIDAGLGGIAFKSVAYSTYEGTFESNDPRFAVDFLTKHIEGFLKGEIARAVQVAATEVEFLQTRVKEREDELRRTEEALEKFKSENMVGLPEFAGQHVTSREALYKRRSELSAQMTRAGLELGAARKRLSEEAPILTKRTEGAQPYEQALVDVRRRLGEARAKGLGDQHPEVAALMKQEDELQKLANQARNATITSFEKSANPGLIDLKNRVADFDVAARAAGAELGEINAQLARLDGIVGKMPEVEAKFAELTRSYGVNTELHAQLLSQLRQKQLALDLERSSVMARYEVLVPPFSSGVHLRRLLIVRVLIGSAIGLALGVLIVAFLEFRQRWRARRVVGSALMIRTPGP